MKYFSIHCLTALKNNQFSILLANVENTPENMEKAKRLYPYEFYHIEIHSDKINMSPVI